MKKKSRKTYKSASRYNLLYNQVVDEGLPGEARWLLVVLDSFADKDGRPRFKPTVEKILQRADMGRTRFYELRALLVAAGRIIAVPRVVDGRRLSTEYHIVQDWSGVAVSPVGDCPRGDTTPVRVAAPIDRTLLRSSIEAPNVIAMPDQQIDKAQDQAAL